MVRWCETWLVEPLPAGLRLPPGPPRPPAPPTTSWGPGPHGEGHPRRGPVAAGPGFVAGVIVELRKVAWPTRDAVLGNGFMVLVVVVAVAALLFGLDAALGSLVSSLMR